MDGGPGEALDDAVELEAAIEAVGEAGEVGLRMLRADVVAGAGERGFDVAQAGIDHLNGAPLAARLPEPVAIGKCWQPAFSTVGQQDRPSLTTLLPAAKSRSASRSTSFLRKPLTTLSRSRLGLRSAVVSTAATIGVLPAAPRPRLPPGRSPPR